MPVQHELKAASAEHVPKLFFLLLWLLLSLVVSSDTCFCCLNSYLLVRQVSLVHNFIDSASCQLSP